MISIRIPADLIARLDAHAQRTGTTRSDLIRRAAERLLQEATMDTITDRDIAAQVTQSLTEHVDGYNVDGIVRDIIDRYGRVYIDTIDDDQYWALVEQHAR